ncbi:DUF4900 domain-containing protein [Deinococcus sp. KSM4-11]|uniref:DUF4900 domain-containing protein n=1 Tax=Deinococcus sp. KSM4-11 TaxID=2568654 RepID=UPI0010A31984|nr:DUF4900 domain-containing protein [Deinococcus sp. KSM4-11]THF86465.1 DUF4900 domain-containing protein [Deinococcus sp. KSM4-11]
MKHERTHGYILVTALAFMVVLIIMTTIIMTGSVTGVQQAGGEAGLVRARAAAEAGQAQAGYTLSQTLVPGINSIIATYAGSFAAAGSNPSTTPVIPTAQYSSVLSSMNSLPSSTNSGTVGGVTFSSRVTFSNFRADQASFNANNQRYLVDYVVASTGQQGNYLRNVNAQGYVAMTLGKTPLNQFLVMANDGGSLQGNFFGTGMNYDGPVHINKNWSFAGTPIFSMGATTAASSVQMYNCNTGTWQSVTTQSNNCTTPNWGGAGLAYSRPTVPLPGNAFSQARAALGLNATNTTSPSTSERCTALGLSSCSSVPTGVYTPANGGIYIEGNAAVTLSVASPSNNQVYTIVQGTTTTVLTTNAITGVTTVTKNGGAATTLTTPLNGQLYVEGTITSLSGPARTGSLPTTLPTNNAVPSQIPPAVASTTKLNIAAATDIVVQGDVTYQDNPSTNASAKNVLAILAGTGNVRIGTLAPNDVYLHGAVVAGASGKGLSADSYNINPARGAIHTLGSLAEDTDPPRGLANIASNGAITMVNGFGDAFHFDPRFVNGSAIPPFFPTTTTFSANTALPVQRSWNEQ